MKHQKKLQSRRGIKALAAIMLAAAGLLLLGAAPIAGGGEVTADRIACGDPSRSRGPCAGPVASMNEEENDSMKMTTVQSVTDTSIQGMPTSASGVTRSATFAMG